MFERCPVCNSRVESGASVCAACGFRLASATEKIEPITVGVPVQRSEEHKVQQARFVVVRGEQLNSVYMLDEKNPSRIGRSPRNDIFLNDMTVSSTHAEVFVTGGTYVIRDLGSFNGVWVNNVNVGEAPLRDGDIVQIGGFCLLFEQ